MKAKWTHLPLIEVGKGDDEILLQLYSPVIPFTCIGNQLLTLYKPKGRWLVTYCGLPGIPGEGERIEEQV